MYAIVKTGGKQYKVSEGDLIRVESLQAEVGDSIELDHVLLISQDGKATVGSPFIEGVKVKASIASVGREKKITVIKFRRRKDSRLKQGHRQYYTELMIESIVSSSAKNTKTTAKDEVADDSKKGKDKPVVKTVAKKSTPKKVVDSAKKPA